MEFGIENEVFEMDNSPLKIRRALPEKAEALLILAHGAGAGMDSLFMRTFQENLARLGVQIVEFDFSYILTGRKTPSHKNRLMAEWRTVIEKETANGNQMPVFIGGKSMGGRIAGYIFPEYPYLSGLIFLGYPLHAPGKPEKLRAEHLFLIQKPMLFVSGTRDRLAQLELLQNVVQRLGKCATLYSVENGDHSLQVPKRAPVSTDELWRQSCGKIVAWMDLITKQPRSGS